MRLTEVFTLREIEQVYGLKVDKIKSFLRRGADGWIENIDYKKSGGTWLVTRKALIDKFDIDLSPDDELFL
ncbi:helix-turn-helix domain-containing protein [uncultured Clostridium sp.]|uniref:helix-turn-helix domain-containing protein n=1 Tax=uncultured Clostridium sp. TaxID=59620 RepID=UPI002630ED74|nr:helix-turn-helix domain-containing protein [uncultured Clostridium sp.]